jgi:hypothetical protein
MMSSETENAIAANVIVAPAIVLNNARALSTVDVNTSGNWLDPSSSCRSTRRLIAASAIAPKTEIIGTTNRLDRRRSPNDLSRNCTPSV